MTRLIVDFEWPVADTYHYEPPTPPSARSTLASSGESFGFIVASGESRHTRPLDSPGPLLKILLSDMPLHETACMLAPAYGMLTGRSGQGEREPLGLWKQLADELRSLQELQRPGVAPLGISIGARLEVLLLPAQRRQSPRLAFRPVNLREAIKIYWATTIVSGGTLRPCKQCGEFFEAGGESARRADAQFCSDDCRHRFNNDRKRVSAH